MGERLRAELVHLGGGGAARDVGIHREAGIAQPAQEVVLRRHVQRSGIGNGIQEGSQVATGRDLGILLAKASRGGVPRVGEGVAPLGIRLFVQAQKAPLGHVYLAAHLDGRGSIGPHVSERRFGKPRRNVFDGAHVERHVLPRRAVTTGGRAHKEPVFVGECHAQAIDLELAGIGGLARTERRLRAVEPLIELFEVHGVVHGIHARHVRDRLELRRHVPAHALRVGMRRHELGIRSLQLLELHEHLVERRIRNLGSVQGVVAICMVFQLVVELRRPSCGRTALLICALRRWLMALGRLIRCAAQIKQALLLCHSSPITYWSLS